MGIQFGTVQIQCTVWKETNPSSLDIVDATSSTPNVFFLFLFLTYQHMAKGSIYMYLMLIPTLFINPLWCVVQLPRSFVTGFCLQMSDDCMKRSGNAQTFIPFLMLCSSFHVFESMSKDNYKALILDFTTARRTRVPCKQTSVVESTLVKMTSRSMMRNPQPDVMWSEFKGQWDSPSEWVMKLSNARYNVWATDSARYICRLVALMTLY